MLKEFKLLDSNVLEFSFKAIKEPSQTNGFYSYSMSPAGDVKCTDNVAYIEIINTARIDGYSGVPPENDSDLNDMDKVFELLLSFRLVYSIPEEDKEESLLLEKNWFFDIQAKIFSKQVIQSFLSNTSYHNIAIPLQ